LRTHYTPRAVWCIVAIGSNWLPCCQNQTVRQVIVNGPNTRLTNIGGPSRITQCGLTIARAEGLPSMDITSFVVQGRDKALLYGDYSTYHAQLCKRLLNSRKRLGIATRNRGKFHKKGQLSPDEVAQNIE
jgi:hypothetical protein